MKQIIIAFMVMLNIANAQDKIEKIGPNIDKKETEFFKYNVGEDETSFYILRSDLARVKTSYGIEQFSKTTLTKIKQIALIKYNKFTIFLGALHTKTKFYLFTKQYNIPDKKAELVVDEFNANKVNTESKRTVIKQFDTDNTKWFSTNYRYTYSDDKSKIGFISYNSNDISFDIYNLDGLTKISSNNYPNANEEIKAKFSNPKLDNNDDLKGVLSCYNSIGGISISKKLFTNEKDIEIKIKSKERIDFIDPKTYLDLKTNILYVYTMFYNKNENEKNKEHSNGGIYIAKIDYKTLNIISEKYTAFSPEILSRLTCDKPHLFLDNYNSSITILDNSEILFHAMSSNNGSVSRGTGTSGYDMSQKQYLSADGILVAKFKPTLELVWTQLVPRNITYSNITNSTESTIEYSEFIDETSISYLFIEHPKFEEKKIDFLTVNVCKVPEIKNYVKSNLVKYKIDFHGKLTKEIIYFNDDKWLIPNLGNIKAGENKYIMRFRKGDDESFGILNLK